MQYYVRSLAVAVLLCRIQCCEQRIVSFLKAGGAYSAPIGNIGYTPETTSGFRRCLHCNHAALHCLGTGPELWVDPLHGRFTAGTVDDLFKYSSTRTRHRRRSEVHHRVLDSSVSPNEPIVFCYSMEYARVPLVLSLFLPLLPVPSSFSSSLTDSASASSPRPPQTTSQMIFVAVLCGYR